MDFPAGQTLSLDHLRRSEEVRCDVAIIGSGAGGAAAAWALSRAGLKVALLEEGKLYQPSQFSKRTSWAYRHIYQERGTRVMTGSLYIPLPGGRVVGGSTVLNSAICFRAPERVLRRWREEFGLSWADASVLDDIFAEVERVIGVVKTHPAIARTNNLLFKAGADKLGLGGDFISRNAPGCVGCGLCQLGCPVGGKGSVDRNFIPLAQALGAALFTSVRAQRLLLSKGAAVGVECEVLEGRELRPVSTLTVRADRVFLCGGAIGSPLFLARQRLGQASGALGKHLRVHPAVGAAALFDQVVDPWDGVTQGYYVDLGDSILETFSVTPDLYFTQFEAFAQPLERLRHLASCGCMIGDESSGEVSPGEGGRANIRYALNELDRSRLLRGLREVGRVFFAAGARQVQSSTHGTAPSDSLEKYEQALPYDLPLERLSVYASHPMGTCRMGASAKSSVVGPQGELWDVKNLYVADASIFPTSLGVNPQLTVMAAAVAIARRLVKPS